MGCTQAKPNFVERQQNHNKSDHIKNQSKEEPQINKKSTKGIKTNKKQTKKQQTSEDQQQSQEQGQSHEESLSKNWNKSAQKGKRKQSQKQSSLKQKQSSLQNNQHNKEKLLEEAKHNKSKRDKTKQFKQVEKTKRQQQQQSEQKSRSSSIKNDATNKNSSKHLQQSKKSIKNKQIAQLQASKQKLQISIGNNQDEAYLGVESKMEKSRSKILQKIQKSALQKLNNTTHHANNQLKDKLKGAGHKTITNDQDKLFYSQHQIRFSKEQKSVQNTITQKKAPLVPKDGKNLSKKQITKNSTKQLPQINLKNQVLSHEINGKLPQNLTARKMKYQNDSKIIDFDENSISKSTKSQILIKNNHNVVDSRSHKMKVNVNSEYFSVLQDKKGFQDRFKYQNVQIHQKKNSQNKEKINQYLIDINDDQVSVRIPMQTNYRSKKTIYQGSAKSIQSSSKIMAENYLKNLQNKIMIENQRKQDQYSSKGQNESNPKKQSRLDTACFKQLGQKIHQSSQKQNSNSQDKTQNLKATKFKKKAGPILFSEISFEKDSDYIPQEQRYTNDPQMSIHLNFTQNYH